MDEKDILNIKAMSVLIILSSIIYVSVHYLLVYHFKKLILQSDNVEFAIKSRKNYSYLRFTLAFVYGIIVLYSLFSGPIVLNTFFVGFFMSIAEMQSKSLPVHFKYPSEVIDPFILYLRGFSEDNYELSWRDLQKRSKYDDFSEGAFFFIASQYMHCYSVGMTKELSSPIGTERIYLTDDNWKEGVKDLMTRASLIFINIHDSNSCMWEIIQAQPFASKTVIICDKINRLIGMRAKLNKINYYGLPFFTQNRTYAFYDDIENKYQIFSYDNNNKSYKRIINLILRQKCELIRYFTVTNRFLFASSLIFGIICIPLIILLFFVLESSLATTIFVSIVLFYAILVWCCIFPVANYPWRSQK